MAAVSRYLMPEIFCCRFEQCIFHVKGFRVYLSKEECQAHEEVIHGLPPFENTWLAGKPVGGSI